MPERAMFGGAEDAFFRRGSDVYRGGPPEGLLQTLHPAARILGALLVLLGVSLSRNPLVLVGVFALAIAVAILSFLNLKSIYRLMLVPVVLLALPAWLFSILWYSNPGVGSMLFVRTLASVSVVIVALHSVGLRQVTGVMEFFRLPFELRQMWSIMVAQIASFTGLVADMNLARKARQVGRIQHRVVRNQVGRQAGILFARTWQRGNDLAYAQAARTIMDQPRQFSRLKPFEVRDFLLLSFCGILFAGLAMV